MVAHSTSVRTLKASPRSIAQHVLEATIEIVDEPRDIIYRKGKYGEFFLVRSSRFSSRYYVVVWNETQQDYECSCPQKWHIHEHNRRVFEYVQREILAKATLSYDEIGDPRVA